MHLITFILKALVTAIATALPQGIENNNQNQDQLDQTQPYHDQSLSEYTNYLKEAAQDTSAGDSLGSVNYVASSPNELNIPSIQDTSSGDNSAGLDELAQESITDTSNLDVPPTATYSERIPPFCDEKSELPSEHFNILVSRSKWKFMPNCGLYKEATCCSSFLKIEGGNVEGCTDDWPTGAGCTWGRETYCCEDVQGGRGINCSEVPPQPTPTAKPPKKPKWKGPKIPIPVWAPAGQKAPQDSQEELCLPK